MGQADIPYQTMLIWHNYPW